MPERRTREPDAHLQAYSKATSVTRVAHQCAESRPNRGRDRRHGPRSPSFDGTWVAARGADLGETDTVLKRFD
jgi:hypothetical protein